MKALQAARLYQEMVTRWLRARRDHPYNNEQPPVPPKALGKQVARSLFENCEREFNRGKP